MALFKVLVKEKDGNKVLLKGDFNHYKTYKKLREELIDKSALNKKIHLKLRESDTIKLSFLQESEDSKNSLYIPAELKEGIWDPKTYDHFKEKITLRGITDVTYRFYLEIIDKPPKWKKKENTDFLSEALDSSWKPMMDEVLNGINLLKLEESKNTYTRIKNELKSNEENINMEIHKNIICNNCFKKDFQGKRFICAECNNYNICQECEKLFYQKQIHPRDHTLIQVNKALIDDNLDNLSKYNNIFGNNNREFKNVSTAFPIEITLINNGENNLKNCYILPIRYGEEYLTCNPTIISEDVQRNMPPIKLIMLIKVPNSNKGYFEGYFRMFTPHGLPFGNVLFIKVLNGD